ncbi:aminoglycoside 6'-N-acetyltransferase [Devosia nitrariae]|uniref:aminoglycoside 6'-N-acetyltransferase n=1 Tax=Devosia nitrariae TaxID=2071872 RepID=UPI0024E0A56B|nr:aminoglycoside 6'-N-acetyltransferase [Devosia nitrariae]
MHISPARATDHADWLAMRVALWPGGLDDEHGADIEAYDEDAQSPICLIARNGAGVALGFAEAALRHDYVNGCKTSPVAFLEGIYVRPDTRGRGVARKLVAAVEAWAAGLGCTEFASDAALDNVQSHAMHKALGFTETQRVVYFRKSVKA